LWTLIPSNKAILPVLWQLFPNHPYLLETAFELTTSLQETGYVVKPIVGRCGSNITIVDGSETIREETAGNFGHRDRIYQQFCPLPELDGRYVQICSFSVDGSYAASCVRLDRAMVINDASDVLALRVLPDSDYAMSGGI
jgi:glutathionylspermidine amidase/synthetase